MQILSFIALFTVNAFCPTPLYNLFSGLVSI
jgi:hypothetical protein